MRLPSSTILLPTIVAAAIFVSAPVAIGPTGLESSVAYAGGHKEKHQGKRHKDKKHMAKKRGHGGPPPWAPAHGYRRKMGYHAVDNGIIYRVAPSDLIVVPTTQSNYDEPGKCNRTDVGAVIGAAVGGLAGSRFGRGDGKVLATIGGAIAGALIGGNIGRAMDQVDQHCAGQALEHAPNGTPIIWNDQGKEFEVRPTETYQSGGRYCRNYETTIVIDGRAQRAQGTACRQADGSWQNAS